MRRRKLMLTKKILAVAQNIPCCLWDSKGYFPSFSKIQRVRPVCLHTLFPFMLLTLHSANGHRGAILRLTVALDACKAADKVKDIGCDGKELIVRHPRECQGGRFVACVCRAIQIIKRLFHIEYIRFKEIDLCQRMAQRQAKTTETT